jgi:hypothetical protein
MPLHSLTLPTSCLLYVAECLNNKYVTNDPQAPTYIPLTQSSQADQQLKLLFASLRSILALPFNDGKSTLHVVERPKFTFNSPSLTPGFQALSSTSTSVEREQLSLPGNIPTIGEWDKLWAAWDMVTLQMIPQEMLHQKPIDLRHKCLFYIGHIPTYVSFQYGNR